MKKKTLRIILNSLLTMLLIGMLAGCDVTETSKTIGTDDKMKILSGNDTVVEVEYDSLKKDGGFKDSNVVKVGTYENLLAIFGEMELLYKTSTSNSMNSGGFDGGAGNMTGSADMTTEEMAVPAAEAKEVSTAMNDSSAIENNSDDSGHSTTNTQVENVDEADIIKTDGRYIYYLNYNQLYIFDTEGGSPLQTACINISEGHNDSYMNDIFISGDILILSGQKHNYTEGRDIELYNEKSIDDSTADWPEVYKSYTVFEIYDISDRSEPVLDRTVEVEGSLVSTRLVGNKLYFITNKWLNMINFDDAYDYEILPIYRDTAVSEGYQVVSPDMISYFTGSRDSQYMLVGAFDVTSDDEAVLEAYIGSGTNIYMNTSSLYISKNIYDYNVNDNKNALIDWTGYYVNTEIYRFAVEGLSIDYKGSVIVPGNLINQYAMDEYKGILRVGSGYNSIGNGITNVDIETMRIVGSIQGLAKTEQIYSVRFMGDVGYMVTYRQTDPLFVFDLSDPLKPVMTGELKIPGFSQYLHPVGKNYLVGFGRNTGEVFYQDENGDFISTGEVRDLGFKLSLFDISDMNNPKEVYVKLYSNYSYSEVSYNPKSIMVDASKDIFAFPINRPDYSQNNYKDGCGGTVVQIDPENGFVTLADVYIEGYSNNSRFCFIGSRLYYVYEGEIVVMSYPECEIIGRIKF